MLRGRSFLLLLNSGRVQSPQGVLGLLGIPHGLCWARLIFLGLDISIFPALGLSWCGLVWSLARSMSQSYISIGTLQRPCLAEGKGKVRQGKEVRPGKARQGKAR